MKEYVVLYHYDYYEMDGYGWEDFDDEKQALNFISKRMKDNKIAKLTDFTLLKCEHLKLKPKKVIESIVVDYE